MRSLAIPRSRRRIAIFLGAFLIVVASQQRAECQNIRIPRWALPNECFENSLQSPPAVVARGKLDVSGEIDGSVWTNDLDSAAFGAAAKVQGDLWVSAAKKTPKAGDRVTLKERLGQLDEAIARPDLASRIEGKQRSLPRAAALPRFPRPSPAKKGRNVVRESSTTSESWDGVSDLAIRRGAEVSLPPGAYGDITNEKGVLILGLRGAHTPARYTFGSLAIKANAELRVAGPVVINIEGDATINGVMGNAEHPEWLDIRCSGKMFEVGNSGEIVGYLVVPDGSVVLKPGAEITGAATGDSVSIAGKSRVKSPPRKLVRSIDLPMLSKALVLEARAAALTERHRNDYSISVGYPDDVPNVLLIENSRSGNAKFDQINDRLALLGALADSLIDTGFDKAVVTIVRSSGQGAASPQVTNYPFTRREFERALRFAGKMNNPQDNIRKITDDHLTLSIFAQYCTELAEAKRQAGK